MYDHSNEWPASVRIAMKSIMKHWGTWHESPNPSDSLEDFYVLARDQKHNILYLGLSGGCEDAIVKVDYTDYPTKITTYFDDGIKYYLVVDTDTTLIQQADL